MIPGELLAEPGERELNPGRPTTLGVENAGDRPVWGFRAEIQVSL
jgi:urease subunit beta